MPTPAVEDYLKAIYQLAQGDEPVGTSAIAERLGVAPGSVTGMLKRLGRQGLVEHERYQGARLTDRGRREAIRMIRRHRVLELFLVEVLGYTWDQVHRRRSGWSTPRPTSWWTGWRRSWATRSPTPTGTPSPRPPVTSRTGAAPHPGRARARRLRGAPSGQR
jgi:DtxR family transcriptional regulator, Mn-dependent transcriptional regulator